MTITGKTIENQPTTILLRLPNPDGSLIDSAEVSSITYKAYNRSTKVEIDTGSISTSILNDELTSDDRWTADDTGFNSEWTIPATCFPDAGLVRIEIEVTKTDSTILRYPIEIEVMELFSI